MQDAFDFYNAITEPIRTELEIELTTLLSNSILDVKLPIEIKPLEYKSTNIENIESNEDTTNNQ